MSAAVVTAREPDVAVVASREAEMAWLLPSRGRVGMYGLICAEAAIFTIFVVAYLFYLGKSQSGPRAGDVLHAPIVLTICLLSSSLTIHSRWQRCAERGERLRPLVGAHDRTRSGLPRRHCARVASPDLRRGLTIRTNLFGTTYYSLVGCMRST
jgi:cytochrome c oxidase subunit 3/cytochrome o ubiquinol oxidase subunit 3